MKRAFAIALAAIVLQVNGATAHELHPCDGGRFQIEGFGLLGVGTSDIVGVADGRAWIDSGCPPIEAKIRENARRVRIKAVWESCDGTPGKVKLTAKIDKQACHMSGKVRHKGLRLKTKFEADLADEVTCEDGDDTFEIIQQDIFVGRGCTLSTCHGNFPQGNLDLRPGASLLSLIGVPADNPTANASGKLRVVPGDASSSFLSQKLRNFLAPGEGTRMPLIGPPLPAAELNVIDAWIDAGAPPTGIVTGAPCLEHEAYEPVPAPPAPAGGYQIIFDGPWLAPGQELEGCFWVPVPNAVDFDVARFEHSLNPGTHHYAIFPWQRAGIPPLGVLNTGDPGCISGSDFGNTVTGAPQAPFFVAAYPDGVAYRLEAGGYLGLNAHYFNEFDVPIQMKVYTNLIPYSGTPDHLARTIIDFDDMLSEINVPPGTQRTMNGIWSNPEGQTLKIFNLTGHMHKRGVKFTAWDSSGTKLYENFDWAHPIARIFDPPLEVAPGDFIEYECVHDNGVTRPFKLNAAGNPTTLTFGVSADDEMCTVNGSYFVD